MKSLDDIIYSYKPDAVAVNPLSGIVYVSNQDANRVTIIDGKTNKVITTLVLSSNYSVDKNNYSELSINPVTNMIYVSDKQMDSISIINGTTNSLVKFVKLLMFGRSNP